MKDDRNEKHKWRRHGMMAMRLIDHGFIPTGMFKFSKGGKVYDLSAADLNQIDRIEREGLFVVAQ